MSVGGIVDMIHGAQESCFIKVISAVADWYELKLEKFMMSELKMWKRVFSNILELFMRLDMGL